MDVADFIKREGQTLAPNSQYNPKAKKNKQPKIVVVDDLDYRPSGAVSMAIQDANRQTSIDADAVEVYRRNGLNWNPWENLDKELSDRQSNWTKFGNMLAQTLISEIGLGTIKGISDLFDVIGNAFSSNDNDYTNPVSAKLEEWQEQFKAYAPIYYDTTKNIGNGGLSDFGWWMSNMPSVASSLTLLIPGAGVVKGASAIGKAAKIGSITRKGMRTITGVSSKLNKARRLRALGYSAEEVAAATKLNRAQRFLNSANTARGTSMFLENTTMALVSRTVENYQEARQTYNDFYEEASNALSKMNDDEYAEFLESNQESLQNAGIDTNDRDAVAKHLASKAADRTFQIDWLNVGFDILQMYGLRNAWKGIKNANDTPAAVRRAQKNAAKWFGKSKTEIEAELAKRSFRQKAADWAEDRLYGSKLILTSELSEGIEEAINTIATKEGIHYGRTLLGTEDATSSDDMGALSAMLNGFDGRLKSYMNSPELWDSAFWGVMGGIVFQSLGSKFNQIKSTIENRTKKDDAGNGSAEQTAKQQRHWWQLDELPENQRRIEEIYQRNEKFGRLKTQLDQINDNKNPFDVDESGNPREFTSEEEKELARKKLMDAYITDMTLTAAHSGNLDMLKAYIADDNVRKAMIEQGFFAKGNENKTEAEIEAESKEYVDNILKKVEEVEQNYEDELIAVQDAAIAGNRNLVPVEYLEIIATDNLRAKQEIDGYTRELASTEARIAQLEQMFSDNLDPNIDYRSQVRLQVLTNELGHLRAQRRMLSANADTLTNKIAIDNLDKKIAEIEDQLDDAELKYATFQSLRYVKHEDGSVTQENTPEAFAYRDRMITRQSEDLVGSLEQFDGSDVMKALGLSTRAIEHIDSATKGRYDVMEADTATINNLRNISPELDRMYRDAAAADLKIKWTNQDINRTVDEVEGKLSEIHNSLDEARRKAINQANKTIIELFDKYGSDIEYAIWDSFNKKDIYDSNLGDLSEAERKELSDALKVLALDRTENRSLAQKISSLLYLRREMNSSQEEESSDEESEGNVISDDEISADDNPVVDNPSTDTQNADTEGERGQNSDDTEQIDPQNISNRTPLFYANFYTKGKSYESNKHRNQNDNNQVAVYDNGDGTFTIVPQNDRDMRNRNFFGNVDGVDLLAPYKIATYPIARKNKRGKLEIIKKGELTNNMEEAVQEDETAPVDNNVPTEDETSQPVEESVPTEDTTDDETAAPVTDEIKPDEPVAEESNSSSTGEGDNTPTIRTTSETKEGLPFYEESIRTPLYDMDQTRVVKRDGKYYKPAYENGAFYWKELDANNNNDRVYMEMYDSMKKASLENVPPVNDVEPVIDQSSSEDDIRNKALAEFIKAVKENHDANLDELAEKLINEEVAKGATREIAEQAVNKSKAVIQRRLERQKAKHEDNMLSSVDEVLITQTSLIDSRPGTDAVTAYQNAVKQMMNQYAKELNLNRINGKLYVNLEDLLRYVNTISSDPTMANMIFASLNSYLGTEEAKKDFVIMDEDIVSKQDFFDNVAKTEEQRRKERLGDDSVHRVFIDGLDNFDAFDELQAGDELQVVVGPDEIMLCDQQGRTVGFLPAPRIDGKTGAYKMRNDDWIYDVLANNNGGITSKLKDRFYRWLTSTDPACQELNAIIYELAYDKPDATRKQQLLNMFKNNAEVQAAKRDGLTDANASDKKLLNGLVKIWRFENRLRLATVQDQNANIRASVDAWFEKLRGSYDNVYHLGSITDGSVKVIVNDVSDGELIRIVENDKVEAESQALPADKAIAGGVNPDIHKIAITSRQSGALEVSGGESLYLPAQTAGITMVVIPNRSGRPGFVQAFPAIISDDYIGNDAKEIVQAIKDEARKLIKEHADNPSAKTYEALRDFFQNVFQNDRGNNGFSSLFRGVVFSEKIYGNNRCFSLTLKDKGGTFITIYERNGDNTRRFSTKAIVGNSEFEKNAKGYQTKNFEFSDDTLIKHFEEIINSAQIQFNFNYIASDGHSNMNFKGLATKENGKFKIKVGDKTWEYNLFNEFILNNNLVRLNTKPSDDGKSNYTRKGTRSQRANQTLNIRVISSSSSPVENTPQQAPITQQAPISGKSVNEQVIDIINSDSKTKGVDIVRAIIGTDSIFTDDVLKMFENLGILPNNIIFDAELNNRDETKHINAYYNRADKNVYVGQKWIDMFSNPQTRSQAIRKLIHEQLHHQLVNHRGYVRSAREIYDEFKKYLDKNNVPQDARIREYLFDKVNAEGNRVFSEEDALEEFLVESLTSAELANYLNQIDAEVNKKKGARNLFQKILELMAKVFNWKVREGSLYEKELHTLREIMNDNVVEDRQAVEEASEIVNRIIKDGEKASLTEDEVYYVNEETNVLGIRVTSAIQADIENVGPDGVPHRFDKNSPWITPSTNIGTGVDEFTRDFFLGKLDNLSEEELEAQYPNVTGQDWALFREQLKDFRDKLRKGEIIKGKNVTIVSRDIKAMGQVDVTMPDGSVKKLDVIGTLDLLGYDQDGKFYVFDMKTVHSNSYLTDTEKGNKWNRQLQLYKQFLQDKYGIEVAGTYIIPIKVNYDTPKGATFKDGKDMGGTAVYTVRNPELKTDYNNPNRTQLLQDGEEFREAAPELQPILAKNPKPGNIKYEYLDDAAKAVLDGTVTVDNYRIQPTNEEETTDNVEPEELEDATSDDISGILDDDNIFSSVTEITPRTISSDNTTNIATNVPSVQSMQDRLPLSQQADFASLIERGEFMTSCR